MEKKKGVQGDALQGQGPGSTLVSPSPTASEDTAAIPIATLTEGDWWARECPSSDHYQFDPEVWEVCWSEDGECVAEVVHGEANARLFAASKDLLGAAMRAEKRLLALDSEDNDIMRELRAAIAKATKP